MKFSKDVATFVSSFSSKGIPLSVITHPDFKMISVIDTLHINSTLDGANLRQLFENYQICL